MATRAGKRSAPIGLLLIGAFVLAGCASSAPDASSVPVAVPAASETAAEFAALDYSEVINYVPARSNAEIAAGSDAVVTGTIAGWAAGTRMEYDHGGLAMGSIILEIRDTTVVEGDAAKGEPIYVGIITGDGSAEIAASLPTGVPVIAYLDRADDAVDTDDDGARLVNLNGGRPEGSQLWVLSSVQGLAVQPDAGQLLWPIVGTRAEGELADAWPGGSLVG